MPSRSGLLLFASTACGCWDWSTHSHRSDASVDASDVPVVIEAGSEFNVLPNPDCEFTTSGWTAWEASLTRNVVATAHSGSATCLVRWQGDGPGFSLDSYMQPYAFPAGRTRGFRASAWVRSSSSVGRGVYLFIEFTGGAAASYHSVGSSPLTLTEAWQPIAFEAHADRADRTGVHMFVYLERPTTGDSFESDDLALVETAP